MKKGKEWLKNEVEDYLAIEGVHDARIASEAVLQYIDQLDEPEITDSTISKKETVEIPQFVANREEEKLYKLKFISKTITETHYTAYRFFSGEYKPMTINSMGLSNGAVGWRYIFTESELETMDLTGFEKVEVTE